MKLRGTNNCESVIDRFGLRKVFHDLLSENLTHDTLEPVFYWIISCFSRNSQKLLIDADWQTIKKTVAEELKVPDNYFDEVVQLKVPGIRKSALAYLDFQNDRMFSHISMLNIQYEDMMRASVSIPNKKSGEKEQDIEVDLKFRYECGKNADALLERIINYEENLKRDNYNLKNAIAEIELKAGRKFGSTLSVDANTLIKD